MKRYNVYFKGCFIEQVGAKNKKAAIEVCTGRKLNPGYTAEVAA